MSSIADPLLAARLYPAAGCWEAGVFLRLGREQVIFRQIKAQNRSDIGNISRFCNAELAKKGPLQPDSRKTPVS